MATMAAAMGGGEGGGDGGGGGHPDGDGDGDGDESSSEMTYGSRGTRTSRSASRLAAARPRSAIRQPHAPQRHSAAARPRSAIRQPHAPAAPIGSRTPTMRELEPGNLRGSQPRRSCTRLHACNRCVRPRCSPRSRVQLHACHPSVTRTTCAQVGPRDESDGSERVAALNVVWARGGHVWRRWRWQRVWRRVAMAARVWRRAASVMPEAADGTLLRLVSQRWQACCGCDVKHVAAHWPGV